MVFVTDETEDYTIDNIKYSLKKPPARDHAKYEKQLGIVNDSEEILELSYKYLEKLGLSKDISEKLRTKQLFALIADLAGLDKKK